MAMVEPGSAPAMKGIPARVQRLLSQPSVEWRAIAAEVKVAAESIDFGRLEQLAKAQ